MLNLLPDDKILASLKVKALLDDNCIPAPILQFLYEKEENIVGKGENADYHNGAFPAMVQFLFEKEENIVEKGENAGYQHFLLFPQCFKKAFSSMAPRVVILR